MLMYFCALAGHTFARPLCDISVETRPDEFCGHRLLGSLNTGMAQSMYDIEDSSSEVEGHKWPCRSVRDIDEDKSIAERNFPKLETGAGVPKELSEVRV